MPDISERPTRAPAPGPVAALCRGQIRRGPGPLANACPKSESFFDDALKRNSKYLAIDPARRMTETMTLVRGLALQATAAHGADQED
jgi:hypothetical protein